MAKKRMTLLGIIRIFRGFFAHQLAKYQYFSMRPSLFVYYCQFSYILSISARYILTWGIYGLKVPKSAQNWPYLSHQLLPNYSHQKSFTPYIFQYFRLKFKIWLLN